MIEKIRRGGNYYFTTYALYDTDTKEYKGLLEDHHTDVKRHYYVGWYFAGKSVFGPNASAQTESFYNEENAVKYALTGEVTNE